MITVLVKQTFMYIYVYLFFLLLGEDCCPCGLSLTMITLRGFQKKVHPSLCSLYTTTSREVTGKGSSVSACVVCPPNGWHDREGLPGLSVSACVVCPPLLWNGWHARESLPVYVYFKWAPKEPCLSICVNCEQCMPIIVCTVQGPADWGALSDTCHVHARMGILPVYLWLLNQCCFS